MKKKQNFVVKTTTSAFNITINKINQFNLAPQFVQKLPPDTGLPQLAQNLAVP